MSRNNSCFVVGNLGMDPVERARSENGPIVGFSVAENVQTFDPETKEYKTVHTNWFNVTAFGSTADRIKRHLKKGDRVAVQGRMKVSKYTGKDGEEKNGFEIIADEVALWKTIPGADASPSSNGPQKSVGSNGRSDPSARNGRGSPRLRETEDNLPF
jgi:single-strand DNA-binding protein